jgi:hypothetical protein
VTSGDAHKVLELKGRLRGLKGNGMRLTYRAVFAGREASRNWVGHLKVVCTAQSPRSKGFKALRKLQKAFKFRNHAAATPSQRHARHKRCNLGKRKTYIAF